MKNLMEEYCWWVNLLFTFGCSVEVIVWYYQLWNAGSIILYERSKQESETSDVDVKYSMVKSMVIGWVTADC